MGGGGGAWSDVRPSVCGAVISEPNARICFKLWLLLPLGDMLGRSVCRFMIFFFLRIFFVFVNMGSYGRENFETLPLLQIAAESFQTFPELSSPWSSQN